MRKLICHEEIYSHVKEVHDLTTRILLLAEEHGFGEEALKDLRVALDEAIANAVIHGNSGLARLRIRVWCYLHGDKTIEIRVKDEGRGFDIAHLPDPTEGENLLEPHGRGIFLIRHHMDRVEFNRRGNEIRMWKKRG